MDMVSECLHSLEGVKINISTWDPILIYLLVQKLDPETCHLWESSLKAPKEIPKVSEFLEFLEFRFQALENISNNQQESFKPKAYNNNRYSKNNNQSSREHNNQSSKEHNNHSSREHNNFHSNVAGGCIICGKSH